MDSKDGDICVYFPIESQINFEFLKETNAFSSQLLNKNTNVKGYFGKQGRVRAVKLRGEPSMGYIVPLHVVESFTGETLSGNVGKEFDTIGEIRMCQKYCITVKTSTVRGLGKKPRISRILDGQVRLRVDTEQLRKNISNIYPDDYISITYKTHGTSWWVSNVLGKRKITIFDKLLKLCGVKIQETEYDYFYGSRKVVKNQYETQGVNHFYDSDIWAEIKEEVKECIPKGFTIYGECFGYTNGGALIQKDYDYGCEHGSRRIQVYRITFTNADGIVSDLSTPQVKEFCDKFGLEYVHLFFYGRAKELCQVIQKLDTDKKVFYTDIEEWRKNLIEYLEKEYTEKKCFMCNNDVPEEGIVLRKESLFGFESYKLKSFKFLEHETALLDAGEVDTESAN